MFLYLTFDTYGNLASAKYFPVMETVHLQSFDPSEDSIPCIFFIYFIGRREACLIY